MIYGMVDATNDFLQFLESCFFVYYVKSQRPEQSQYPRKSKKQSIHFAPKKKSGKSHFGDLSPRVPYLVIRNLILITIRQEIIFKNHDDDMDFVGRGAIWLYGFIIPFPGTVLNLEQCESGMEQMIKTA